MPKLREPPNKDDEVKQPVTTAGQSEQLQQEPEAIVAQQQDDGAADELKKQLEALRRSEAAARQEATQAIQQRDQLARYAAEQQAASTRSAKDATDSRLEAIQSGIAAAEAEAVEAKNAMKMATIEQDIDAQIAAQERLTEAKANLINLTNGKAALERSITENAERLKLQQQQRQQAPQQQGDQLDRTNLPQTAKNWLRAHPEYLTDNRKNAQIQHLHWTVVDEGHEPFSTKYYESLEQHLNLRERPRQIVSEDDPIEDEPARQIVSAPVSRESHSSDGQRQNSGSVKLTREQREFAKISGISEADYAKQLVNLKTAKANGNYGGAP